MILGMEGAIVGGERYLEQITTMVLNHGNVSSDHSGSVTEISTDRSQKILLDQIQKVLLEQLQKIQSFLKCYVVRSYVLNIVHVQCIFMFSAVFV